MSAHGRFLNAIALGFSCCSADGYTLLCHAIEALAQAHDWLAKLLGNLYATSSKETKNTCMPNFTPESLAFAFISYMTFLFSTTCHEAAHAVVAKIGGDETASIGGQVTLNPMPHIQREPWGMVLIPILSLLINGSIIGWASAPYDPQWQRRHPRRAAWMALAGPATNYLLMLIAAVGLRMGLTQGWLNRYSAAGQPGFAYSVLATFFFLNLFLGTFNLVPIAPLDGSTAIVLFMSERRAHQYLDWLQGNRYGIVGLLVAVLVFPYVYPPIQQAVMRVLFAS